MAAGFAAAFLDYAVRHGADRNQLFQASGLRETDLADQDHRISVLAYRRLVQAAMDLTGDTALLLRHTPDSRLESISIVGRIVHSSASMPASISQLNRYVRLMTDVGPAEVRERFELIHTKGELWLVDHIPVDDADYLSLEAGFARFISEFRRSFPERRFALGMEVTYPPPPHAESYPALLGIPVRFSADRNALRIDPIWREAEFEAGNEYVFGIFTRHADTLLTDLQRSHSVRARVEARLLPRLHEGNASMVEVARALGMSRQTLYRRLRDEGLTFEKVHDDLRRRMALDYIATRKVTVNEAGYLLGFSEPSAFVRAFRRWTGQTPGSYRVGSR